MWLLYALGGGCGHLTRAAALARIAGREHAVRVLTNSRYAALVAERLPDLDLVVLDPAMPAEAARAAVLREIERARPSHLVVDTFPRGIGGELAGVLPGLDARRILVHRDLNPQYVAAAGLREFVSGSFDLVVAPGRGEGEQFGDLPCAIETEPWLVRSAEELRAGSGEPCVLVCSAGNPEEQSWYGEIAARLVQAGARVRCVALELPAGCPADCWVRYWPAMDLYADAGVVVGGAGYNTVHECAAWGVALVARAWERKYDRQEMRAGRHAHVTLVCEAAKAARLALRYMRQARIAPAPRFVNGAETAARRIAELE
jgi:hypothetical protein